MLPLLPLPDGTRTCWTRRVECLSGFAVTCGSLRKEAVTIVAPLAAGCPARGNGPSQPPGRVCISISPQGGDPALGRDQDCGTGTGLWRISGPLDQERRAGPRKSSPVASPDRGRSNPGGGKIPGMRGAACRMRTSSGEIRAARRLRHPFSLYPEAKPACGPPD